VALFVKNCFHQLNEQAIQTSAPLQSERNLVQEVRNKAEAG